VLYIYGTSSKYHAAQRHVSQVINPAGWASKWRDFPRQAERDSFDFHIRLERDDYVIDVFDNAIDNADDAYITIHTATCGTTSSVSAATMTASRFSNRGCPSSPRAFANSFKSCAMGVLVQPRTKGDGCGRRRDGRL